MNLYKHLQSTDKKQTYVPHLKTVAGLNLLLCFHSIFNEVIRFFSDFFLNFD